MKDGVLANMHNVKIYICCERGGICSYFMHGCGETINYGFERCVRHEDNVNVVSNKAELKTILCTRETEGLANINPLMNPVGRRVRGSN